MMLYSFLSIMKYDCYFTPQNYIDKPEFAFIRYEKSFMSARSVWGAFIRISVARFIETGVRYCDFEQTKYRMGRVKQR